MVLFNAPIRQAGSSARRGAGGDRGLRGDRRSRGRVIPTGPRSASASTRGPALIGNIGGEDVRSFTAIGDTVNLASRLEALAPPGQIVIGEATRDLLGSSVRVEPLGSVEVKGKVDPVRAFLLVRTP